MGEENKATFSMQQVKEILKMHEETVFGFIKLTVERFDTKLDKLTHEIHGINRDIVDLKESENFSTSQVQDVEKKIVKIEEMMKKTGPIFPADLHKKMETNFMEHAEMKKQLKVTWCIFSNFKVGQTSLRIITRSIIDIRFPRICLI